MTKEPFLPFQSSENIPAGGFRSFNPRKAQAKRPWQNQPPDISSPWA